MTDILMRPFVALQVAVFELRQREDGQTTTEYAILLGFLAIAIIIALFFLRTVLRNLFSDAAASVSRRRRPARPHIDAACAGSRAGACRFESPSDGSRRSMSPSQGLGRTRLSGGCPIDP